MWAVKAEFFNCWKRKRTGKCFVLLRNVSCKYKIVALIFKKSVYLCADFFAVL